jgi:hypothetical protein
MVGRWHGLARGDALRYQERPGLHPQLEHLRQRFLAGEPVTLADVFAAAGLSPRERHVIVERLPRPDGVVRSHEQIAADGLMRKPDGSRCSRQRVEQIEAAGLRKLRLSRSIAAAVHGAERAGRALHLMAGRQAVTRASFMPRSPFEYGCGGARRGGRSSTRPRSGPSCGRGRDGAIDADDFQPPQHALRRLFRTRVRPSGAVILSGQAVTL